MNCDMMLTIIIPTINREAGLAKTLKSITVQTVVPEEILIIGQGEQKEERKVVKDFQERLNIKYIYETQRSLCHAKNVGVQNSRGNIICVLDDDVFLHKDYFKSVLYFFQSYPDALGVQGVITNFAQGHLDKVGGKRLTLMLYSVFATIFLLNRGGKVNKFLPSARNVYCEEISRISNCQWLSGCACYHRKVFAELKHKFDENMIKYCYGEDKLFSYELYKKFSQGLYIDPSIQYEHYPQLGKRLVSKDLIKMRILYNYYIWHKVVGKNLKNKILYFWSSCGDLIVYLAKGLDWFKVAVRVYFDIWFKSKKAVFNKYKDLFNFDT